MMNYLKIVNCNIRLNLSLFSTKIPTNRLRYFSTIVNFNHKLPNTLNKLNFSSEKYKNRFISTSSTENHHDSNPNPLNSSSSQEFQDSGYRMDKDNFLRILNLSGDKSNNLMSVIRKCKDDLERLSITSYPFKRYELRVLIELLSGILSIQSSKKDVELLCNLLDSHKSDSKFTSGLDLCKLFSSTYDPVSKRESPFMTKVANRGMMMLTNFFVPNFMDIASEKHLNGVKFAFNSLSESISSRNLSTLESCCNESLFKFIKNGLDFLESLNLKMRLKVKSVEEVNMDKFHLTIGGNRNDFIRDIFFGRSTNSNPILIPNSNESPSNAEEYREMILKSFERGAILRMEVILLANQTLSILDERDEELWKDTTPFCTHRLCFESELKMKSDYKSGKKVDFETGDWVLVDINGLLNNNNPF